MRAGKVESLPEVWGKEEVQGTLLTDRIAQVAWRGLRRFMRARTVVPTVGRMGPIVWAVGEVRRMEMAEG